MAQLVPDQSRSVGYPIRTPQPNSTETVTVSSQTSVLGPSVKIKGEIQGHEPLYIEGSLEGRINIPEHRVTVGRHGQVIANISAQSIVVMGSVRGDVACSDFAEVRRDASLHGDLFARRIKVEEGAVLKGRMEVRADAQESAQVGAEEGQQKAEAKKPAHKKEMSEKPVLVESPIPPASATPQPPTSSGEVKPVAGSSVLFIPSR